MQMFQKNTETLQVVQTAMKPAIKGQIYIKKRKKILSVIQKLISVLLPTDNSL